MKSALHASVCLTVRHTGGTVKTVEVRIMQLSPQSSPVPLVLPLLRYKFNPEILTGSPEPQLGVRQGWGGKTSYF